jgi:hypothetical protein
MWELILVGLLLIVLAYLVADFYYDIRDYLRLRRITRVSNNQNNNNDNNDNRNNKVKP